MAPPDTAVSTGRARIFALRKDGDRARYLAEAEAYLATNRDDLVAADVATMLATPATRDRFAAFTARYAGAETRIHLQFGEIAARAGLGPEAATCARAVLRDESAPCAPLLKAAALLDGAALPDEAMAAAERAAARATKRYQKEDADLFLCRLAAKGGRADAETRRRLAGLAQGALMPQVRKDAAALLGGLK